MPDADEAQALLTAIVGLGIPAWLSYTIAGDQTRAGQPLAQAFELARDVPEVVAVGVNCCDPADLPEAIAIAREATGKPVIVYPNSGEVWDGVRRVWVGQSHFSADQAAQWVAAGARIVGGCCRVSPGIGRRSVVGALAPNRGLQFVELGRGVLQHLANDLRRDPGPPSRAAGLR